MGGKIGTGMDGTSEAQGCGTVAAVAAMWQPAMGGKMQCENVAPLRVGTEWLQSRLGTRQMRTEWLQSRLRTRFLFNRATLIFISK